MLTGVLLWILVYKLSLVPRLSQNANMYRHMYMRYIAIYHEYASTPAQLQCLRSGAWEPGNEANFRRRIES